MVTLRDDEQLCSLIGDFNARTGTLLDFVIPDENLVEVLDENLNDEITDFLYDYQNLISLKIPLKRCSEDKMRPNTQGYKLVEFCKRNNLYITGGRTGSDKGIGKATTKDNSLIDYFIVSTNLFKYIEEYEIIPFDALFSDVHKRIHVKLTTEVTTIEKEKSSHKRKTIKWIEKDKHKFIENIRKNEEKVLDLCNEIESSKKDNHDINRVITSLTNFYSQAAKDSFGTFANKNPIKKNHGAKNRNKPWFNKSCKLKRKQFHSAKYKYNKQKSINNKNSLKRASKEYKKEINKCFQNYQLKTEKELRNISTNNPKEFWKVLNKFSPKQKKESPISLEVMYAHFKKLNESVANEEEEFKLPNLDTIRVPKL
ncbi:unnamed protein product [Mytilus edulis]|uniref:Uncharacterized protein n=1 Tax=Mytilus edulis TaxID=6550 RepID=A0A8S3V5M6_MYTED|nr:unnamed protein product [Mytilus edulis]